MLLINPTSEQFGGMFAGYVPVGIPVATGSLAAYLMKFGHRVKIIDEEVEPLDEALLTERLSQLERPYVIGLSILTAQAARAYEIAGFIKSKWSDSILIAGGIHATALPMEALQNGIDFVVRGEGEVTLLSLLEAIRSGVKDFDQIPGISFLKEGEIFHTPDAKLLNNLDDIPLFPYELFQHPRYNMGFITSSRGCPYKCSYCSQRLVTGLTYRYKSPERIVEELSLLIHRYGQKHVIFYDDNFSVSKRRVKGVCDAIVEAKLHEKASFFVQTRADNLYEEIMPDLRRANFTGVGFGMETAVERLAKVIVKDETVETHKRAIQLARNWGMDVSVFMIFGLPTETREDRMESFRFVKDWDLRFTKFNNLIPYPGTLLYKQYQRSPHIVQTQGWSNFNSTLSASRSIFNKTPLPFVPENTSAWQLKRDIIRCNYSFYFRPRVVLDVILRRGGPGFVVLPKRWFLKPKEIFVMIKLAFLMASNLFVALLPEKVGALFYLLLTGRKGDLFPREKYNPQSLPDAIDGTMRTFMLRSYR